VASRWVAVRDAREEPIAILAIHSDITARKQAEAARHQLLQRLLTVQEEERKRISRELHDQMGQNLTALLIGLKALPQTESASGTGTPQSFQQLQQLTESMMEQVHRLAWELRPPSLDNLGLEAALRQYIEEWSQNSRIAAELIFQAGTRKQRLATDLETMLYREIQEALTNVQRHSHATKVDVILKLNRTEVHAIIEDNGIGFQPNGDHTATLVGHSDGLGLVGMRERVELLGGSLELESSAQGTTLVIRVPLQTSSTQHD
jgi:signal transduction histidine kinase